MKRITSLQASLCVSILLLNLWDATATLRHLGHGATEVNPVMDYFIKRGPAVFILVKHTLVCLSLFLVLLHPSNRAKNIFLFTGTIFFGILGIYQIFLFYLL